ncbi:MAG: TCP-1/cpn60 chaperonin family protein [Candidatus Caldarchaeum sp.]|nr:TCP-1/cpn60 chaperonin family protein [Candidatus Caldarchaeum sp.]MDW7978322.1 thermosome subunit beta [Candidatus Caldarchaeum sp.]MDW8360418.1 thermosome subunit beta [Candidatus Caldarchaeum sp.]
MSLAPGQPVIILKEGTTRTQGRSAQRNNIAAAKIVAEIVRTTLGPKGMDKLLVDNIGDVIVTNDGATILEKIDVEHPAAKMIIEVAKSQDHVVGDGTTSAVVLSGELLRKAEELIEQKIHASTIISGYKKGLEMALNVLNENALKVDLNDRQTLRKVITTALGSKSLGFALDRLVDVSIESVLSVAKEVNGKLKADKDDIQIVKKIGKSLNETELIRGVIVDKEVVHAAMPKRVENAKIALIDSPFEIEKTEFSAEIRIRDPLKIKEFLDEETNILKNMVDKVKAVGANVVFCQKGIDDAAQFFLAKEGILAVRRVKKSDMEKLAKATGGRVVTNFEDLSAKDLGRAGLVEERKIGEDRMVFVEKCENPKSVAILLRAGLERQLDEAERALNDAIMNMVDLVDDPRVVPGGGAIEEELARNLRANAGKFSGKEQLAFTAFAEALEVIPRTLAENAGLEPVEVMAQLRHAHENGGKTIGVNIFGGGVADMLKNGVIEPAKVKIHALRSSFEAASMILRIDDVVAASKKKEEKKKGEAETPEF